eukprot:6214491-Pleurochrysis_carterae.AAC.7
MPVTHDFVQPGKRRRRRYRYLPRHMSGFAAGAGKTFTMMGNLEHMGVIPLTLEDLSLFTSELEEEEFTISMQCAPPHTHTCTRAHTRQRRARART